MSDLIDRKDVLKMLSKEYTKRPLDSDRWLIDVIRSNVKDIPSADNTGEWFIREYEYFTCSECGADHWNGCDCTEEAKERLRNGDYPNFCSNCGANMQW